MATPDLILAAGDLAPSLFCQLLNDDGSAPDLTGKTVQCRVQPTDRSRQASVTAATVIDARGGCVSHSWTALETQLAGFLAVNFVVDPAGMPQTYPRGRSLIVQVRQRLAPP